MSISLDAELANVQTIHKHPHIFGMSGPIAWAEIWNQVGPLSETVLSGTPVFKEDGRSLTLSRTDIQTSSSSSSCLTKATRPSKRTIPGCGYLWYRKTIPTEDYGMPRSIPPKKCSLRGDWQLSERWVNGPVSDIPLTQAYVKRSQGP
jgi:hypothetical protein